MDNLSVSGNGGRVEPSFVLETNTKLVKEERLAKALVPSDVSPVDWISTAVKDGPKNAPGIGPSISGQS